MTIFVVEEGKKKNGVSGREIDETFDPTWSYGSSWCGCGIESIV